MIETGRLRDQLYLAVVIALLLLMSLTNGAVAVAVATLLFAVGLVLYPGSRRTAVIAGLVAAVVAILVAFVRTLS